MDQQNNTPLSNTPIQVIIPENVQTFISSLDPIPINQLYQTNPATPSPTPIRLPHLSLHRDPVGQQTEGRVGLSLRDIQNLSTSNLIRLYECLYDMYQPEITYHLNLTKIQAEAWNKPGIALACDSPMITEVS